MQFTSRLENIVRLDKFILELKEKHHIGEKQYSNMLTCVNEAVTNAIKHGNKCDTAKKVSVHLEVFSARRFIFTVEDEGEGFNWHRYPARTKTETDYKIGGRGIFIMRKLANRLIFNKQGNKVELHFIK